MIIPTYREIYKIIANRKIEFIKQSRKTIIDKCLLFTGYRSILRDIILLYMYTRRNISKNI